MSPNPTFIDGPRGRLFVVHYPTPATGTCVLLLPPFAEELNKCRRQFALQARSLASRGIGAVIADLGGTGDSDGELAATSINDWVDDLTAVRRWIDGLGYRRVVLWGVRFGALLVAPFLGRARDGVDRIVLWQPQLSGKMVVNQFLRLRSVAGMMGGTKGGASVRDSRQQLANGESVEVAGYQLGPELVAQLDELALGKLDAHAGLRVDWFWRGAEGASPGPAEAKAAERLTSAALDVQRHRFDEDAFWSTVETTTAEGLVAQTTAALTGVA